MPLPFTATALVPPHPPAAWVDMDVLASLPLGAGFMADPGGSEAGLRTLRQFRHLMADQGHTVQVARMCFDRLYAYERIALAHASSDEHLRTLALRLFQACHQGERAAKHDA
ncbi:MAG: hypothetical protein U1F53_08010 [Burkholderiaceae bacterium]